MIQKKLLLIEVLNKLVYYLASMGKDHTTQLKTSRKGAK